MPEYYGYDLKQRDEDRWEILLNEELLGTRKGLNGAKAFVEDLLDMPDPYDTLTED